VIAALLLAATQLPVGQDFEAFAASLEQLAAERNLPGLSAAIVQERKLVWSRGFGFADLAARVPATPETRYRIASCSKPIAAVLVMQLVEEDELSLDTPMSEFWIPRWFAPDPQRYLDHPILLRHVLSHTSEGTPGEAYRYNGNLYGDLTFVLEQVTGVAYPTLLQERIFEPLGMRDSFPGHTTPGGTERIEMATSYRWDGEANVPVPFQMMDPAPDLDLTGFDPVYAMPAEATAQRQELLGDRYVHLNGVSSAGGVVSTVLDLAKFDIALDENRLISAASQKAMLTPPVNSAGTVLPYAHGWFVQDVAGVEVLWHYGWLPPGVSALIVKVPTKELSFFLLSNSDRLSADLPWSRQGVTASPFARAFLDAFVRD